MPLAAMLGTARMIQANLEGFLPMLFGELLRSGNRGGEYTAQPVISGNADIAQEIEADAGDQPRMRCNHVLPVIEQHTEHALECMQDWVEDLRKGIDNDLENVKGCKDVGKRFHG